MKSIGNSPRPDGFTAHDARILGRLRTGLAKLADLSDASANCLPVARRLFAAALSDRQRITDDWLQGCIDAEAIKLAVLDTDPARPAAVAVGPEAAVRPAIGVEARLTCAADIQPRVVEWLWTGRIPLGMLTMFAGDPKLGKSYVTLALAAAVSRGAPMPFGAVPDAPGSVDLRRPQRRPRRGSRCGELAGAGGTSPAAGAGQGFGPTRPGPAWTCADGGATGSKASIRPNASPASRRSGWSGPP